MLFHFDKPKFSGHYFYLTLLSTASALSGMQTKTEVGLSEDPPLFMGWTSATVMEGYPPDIGTRLDDSSCLRIYK